MTIQDFSSASSKNNSVLGLLLKAPIAKKLAFAHKKPAFARLNQHQLHASIALATLIRPPATPATAHTVPINQAHHRIDWQWSCTPKSTSRDGNYPSLSTTLFSEDKKTVLFHGECESCFETDAVRGTQALKRNAFTYWEISLLNSQLSGTAIQIGIGNARARLNSLGYVNILGSDENSYGLTHNGRLWHRNESRGFCGAWNEAGVVIGCLFDGHSGRLSFYKNGVPLGVAFEGVDMGEPLYPMISSTVGQSAFRLTRVCETFPSLRDLCRRTVVDTAVSLANERLPQAVLHFLNN